jgi:hypothetical protein
MPPAQPSKASVANVVAALQAAGQIVWAVRVDKDGGFTVETAPVAESAPKAHSEPKRWASGG